MSDIIEEYGGVIVAVIFTVLFLVFITDMLGSGGILRELIVKFHEGSGAMRVGG